MNIDIPRIAGYTFGDAGVAKSAVSLAELEELKLTVGLSANDADYLQMAGGVLKDQTESIVRHWRSGIIATIPHLARHSRGKEGEALPDYLARSNRRFEQWILDTCLRPYDQAWLDYQHEIALRHTSVKKNLTDTVDSTRFVPFRDVLGFIATMNESMMTYLGAKGHSARDVAGMYAAWGKSLQLQIALWSKTYMDISNHANEW